jgi:hypothetical protein
MAHILPPSTTRQDRFLEARSHARLADCECPGSEMRRYDSLHARVEYANHNTGSIVEEGDIGVQPERIRQNGIFHYSLQFVIKRGKPFHPLSVTSAH